MAALMMTASRNGESEDGDCYEFAATVITVLLGSDVHSDCHVDTENANTVDEHNS